MSLSTWLLGPWGAALSLLIVASCWGCTEAGASWHKCDEDATYRLDPWAVTLTPDNPKPKDKMVFDVMATTHDNIAGGEFKLKVYWGWLPVYKDTSDICSVVSGAACPLAPGTNVTLEYTHTLPGDAPRGTYKAKMSAVDSSGANLNCFEIDFGVSSSGEETVSKTRPSRGVKPT